MISFNFTLVLRLISLSPIHPSLGDLQWRCRKGGGVDIDKDGVVVAEIVAIMVDGDATEEEMGLGCWSV